MTRETGFFDSDRNLALTIIGAMATMMLVVYGLTVTFPSPPPQYTNARVTSAYQYSTSLFANRIGTVSSLVEDIHVNATTATYTLSCTFYQVNNTITMVNYHNGDGWIFTSLHIGCGVYAVNGVAY